MTLRQFKARNILCFFFRVCNEYIAIMGDIGSFFAYLTTLCHMRVSLGVECKVVLKNTKFWNVMPCSFGMAGGTCWLYLQGRSS
jgi:hypothetical protein